MHKFVTLIAIVVWSGLITLTASAQSTYDGSFDYQGYLEFNGQPANGDYYFRFSLFDSTDTWLGALYSTTETPVTVVDGLFNTKILMGGNSSTAKAFWDDYGDLVKYLEIEVSEGPLGTNWTLLSPRIELGSSPHSLIALFSEQTKSIQFPYVETVTSQSFSPSIDLTETSNNTLARFKALAASDNMPLVRIDGADSTAISFGPGDGLIRIDSATDGIGIVSNTNLYPIYGALAINSNTNTTGPDAVAVLGLVTAFGTQASNRAIVGSNFRSGTSAALGTDLYAGDFDGDVLARNNLRVQGEPTRDYALNSPSPVGPLAYASVDSNGNITAATANISVNWDNANQWYLVSVAGETLHPSTHVISLSVVELAEPRMASFGTTQGNIIVRIWDLNSGNVSVQDSFSIVIYDPTPATLNNAVQAGPIIDPVEPFQHPKTSVIVKE
jgi:hypothetical protein